MKQQACYQLRYICMGKPFLHNIHIPVIVGQNEQSQSEPCEEEVFCIPLKKKKIKSKNRGCDKTMVWFLWDRQGGKYHTILREGERASHNTLFATLFRPKGCWLFGSMSQCVLTQLAWQPGYWSLQHKTQCCLYSVLYTVTSASIRSAYIKTPQIHTHLQQPRIVPELLR